MGSIHGILPGGKVITNVDVFRKLYEVVGLGWVYAITKFGPINKIANRYAINHGVLCPNYSSNIIASQLIPSILYVNTPTAKLYSSGYRCDASLSCCVFVATQASATHAVWSLLASVADSADVVCL